MLVFRHDFLQRLSVSLLIFCFFHVFLPSLRHPPPRPPARPIPFSFPFHLRCHLLHRFLYFSLMCFLFPFTRPQTNIFFSSLVFYTCSICFLPLTLPAWSFSIHFLLFFFPFSISSRNKYSFQHVSILDLFLYLPSLLTSYHTFLSFILVIFLFLPRTLFHLASLSHSLIIFFSLFFPHFIHVIIFLNLCLVFLVWLSSRAHFTNFHLSL